MAQLKDLVQPVRTVTVDGEEFILHPVTISQFAAIINMHPEFATLLNKQPSMATVAMAMPHVVPEIIAASLRQPEAVEAAGNLSIQTQIEFLDRIAEITIPDGVRPLMEMLAKIVTGRPVINGGGLQDQGDQETRRRSPN